jgi:hypothetical protein
MQMTDTESGNGTELFGKLKMGKEFSQTYGFWWKLGLYTTVINDLYMANEKKQSDSVPMNKLNEVANENYKKIRWICQVYSAARAGDIGLQPEYLESIKLAY